MRTLRFFGLRVTVERDRRPDRWEAQVFAQGGGMRMLYYAPNRDSQARAFRDAAMLREGNYYPGAKIVVRNTYTGEFIPDQAKEGRK